MFITAAVLSWPIPGFEITFKRTPLKILGYWHRSTHLKRSDNYDVFEGEMRMPSKWNVYCPKTGTKQLCQLPSVWRNCTSGVYLDVGTNVGVQLRKLYNPDQFPGAKMLYHFDKLFGMNRSHVCSLGIEPNPYHSDHLKQLNNYFKRKDYPSMVMTETAASVKFGRAALHLDMQSPLQLSASLFNGSWQQNGKSIVKEVDVDLISLPMFMLEVIRPMIMQTSWMIGKTLPVMMKLDVVGAEYSLLPGLLLTGALCDIDVFIISMRTDLKACCGTDGYNMTISDMLQAFHRMRQAYPSCRVKVLNLDDSTYSNGMAIEFPA